MDRSELSTGTAAACGRLDAFVRLAGPELGRWMIEMALGLAERGRRRRTPGDAPRATQRRSAGR